MQAPQGCIMGQSPRAEVCSLLGSSHTCVRSLCNNSVLHQLSQQGGMSPGPDHLLGFCSGAEAPSGYCAHGCLLQSKLTPLHFRGRIPSENLGRETAWHWGSSAWSQAPILPQAMDLRRQCSACCCSMGGKFSLAKDEVKGRQVTTSISDTTFHSLHSVESSC